MKHILFSSTFLLSLLILTTTLFISTAWADDLIFRGLFRSSLSETTTTSKSTGESISTDFSLFSQQYNLDFNKTLFPNLRLLGGARYELSDTTTTTGPVETDAEESLLRPYAELNLNTPYYRAGIGYNTTRVENSTAGFPDREDTRDEWTGLLGWEPVGLPRFNLRYNNRHVYNDPKTVDFTEQLLSFDAIYDGVKGLEIDYYYNRLEDQNELTNLGTTTQNHRFKIDYLGQFLDNRLSLNTYYTLNYRIFEFPGVDSLETQVPPSVGLSGLSNTPDNGPALAVNNALIDGNFVASSGVDIGLDGDETTFTEIGLDFGVPVDVDRILIWVDRRLSASVADSFSWDIYTSPDNLDTSTWTFYTTVSPADFGATENRFELAFSVLRARFVKVVTRALDPSVPDSANFLNIFVTELQAFRTVEVSGQDEDKSTDQNINLQLRGRLSDKTILGYNMFYRLREQDVITEKRSELYNDVYLNYVFNRIFSFNANLSNSDTEQGGVDTNTLIFGSSIRANYLETFQQTLTYSSTNEDVDSLSSERRSLLLRNNADLYAGWSMFLDMGILWETPLEGSDRTTTTLRTGTNLIPDDKLTLNLTYLYSKTERSGDVSGDSTRTELDLQAFFVPFRTLTLSGRWSLLETNNQKNTLQTYNLNWSPFPDGTLQFFFNYVETLRPEVDAKERVITPSLKWTLGRHLFLELFYNIIKNESPVAISDTNSLNGNLRLIF